MSRPGLAHWQAALDVLGYLNYTKTYALELGCTKDLRDVVGYADSDWAGDPDDRKSVSGGIIMWAQCPVLWHARKQSMVCTSTTEAEILAIAELTEPFLMVKAVVGEFFEFCLIADPLCCIVFSDSQPGIQAIGNGSARTKHYHIKVKYIAQLIDQGEFCLEKIASADNLADVFTKPLRKVRLRELVQRILHTILDKNATVVDQPFTRSSLNSKFG
jgi:hypothetical protein